MKLTSNHPFWSVRNGLLADYPGLHHDLTCEAVIVGGGITGALLAIHLVEAGVDTVLIDKRDIGAGSTSASTGLLQYEIDVPLHTLQKKIGRKPAEQAYQLCLDSIGKLERLVDRFDISCGFERKPSLFLARKQSDVAELQAEFAARRAMGIDLEFLDAAAIEARFPFSRPAGLYSQVAAQVDPHRLAHGLLFAAQQAGLQAYDRTEMTDLQTTADGVRVVTQRGAVITARRAIVAAGFESKELLKKDGGSLKSTYALVSEPLSEIRGWPDECLIWETGMPYLYARTTSDRRIIVGGEDEDFVNPDKRDALIGRKMRTLVKKFGRLFPDLPLEVAYAWAGTFGETKDGLAYIDVHPRWPHAYFALGYGGNGITFSLVAAELIRDAFLGKKNAAAELFRFGR